MSLDHIGSGHCNCDHCEGALRSIADSASVKGTNTQTAHTSSPSTGYIVKGEKKSILIDTVRNHTFVLESLLQPQYSHEHLLDLLKIDASNSFAFPPVVVLFESELLVCQNGSGRRPPEIFMVQPEFCRNDGSSWSGSERYSIQGLFLSSSKILSLCGIRACLIVPRFVALRCQLNNGIVRCFDHIFALVCGQLEISFR